MPSGNTATTGTVSIPGLATTGMLDMPAIIAEVVSKATQVDRDGRTIEFDGMEFTVVKKTQRRIRQVKVRKVQESSRPE